MIQPAGNQGEFVSTAGLILAAGKGTRMKSAVPKVLHAVAGRPMLERVLATLADVGVGHTCAVISDDLTGFERFIEANPDLRIAIQQNRQGTGDAVAAAAFAFAGVKPAAYAAGKLLQGKPIDCRHVLIVTGDAPAVQSETLKEFIASVAASGADVGVLGMRTPYPAGYGRLVSNGRELVAIVEDKDADAETKKIDVCNSGIFLVEKNALFDLVGALKPNNAQREYYLTDIVTLARARGKTAFAHVSDAWRDFNGINDRAQLAGVEAWIVERKLASLMTQGVTFRLPATIYIEPEVSIGADSEVGTGSSLTESTKVGTNCRIGANVRLVAAKIGDGVVIGDGSHISHCAIQPGDTVPPHSVRIG